MLRFVVLLHKTPAGSPRETHFDLMLECAGVLRTWTVEKFPIGGEAITAERLPDHRLAYLEYEGPLSGDRGDVRRVDTGEYEVIEEAANKMVVRICGQQLNGILTLSADAEIPQRWRISFSPA